MSLFADFFLFQVSFKQHLCWEKPIYIIIYTYICISSSFAKHQLRYREEKAHENTTPSLHSGVFWFHVLVTFSQLNQFWTNFTMLILNQPRKYLVYDGGIPASNHTVQLFGTFWLEKAHHMARPFHHTVWRQCLARQPRHILGHPQENGAFPCRKDTCFFPKIYHNITSIELKKTESRKTNQGVFPNTQWEKNTKKTEFVRSSSCKSAGAQHLSRNSLQLIYGVYVQKFWPHDLEGCILKISVHSIWIVSPY